MQGVLQVMLIRLRGGLTGCYFRRSVLQDGVLDSVSYRTVAGPTTKKMKFPGWLVEAMV